MTNNRNTGMAIIAACVLMATSAGATDSTDPTGNEEDRPDAAGTNRNLAREAHVRAVEDAIEAVLKANRLNLDSRINARSSGTTPRPAVDGR